MIFRAEPGRVFVGGDISQQEPKITAHISQEPNMLKVFREGKDIYASIAQSIYHNSYEDNLEFFDKEKTKTNLEGKERRKTGKTIILATMYGMGPGTVARKLKLGSKEDAQAMIDAYYSQYWDQSIYRTVCSSVYNALLFPLADFSVCNSLNTCCSPPRKSALFLSPFRSFSP